MGYSRQQFYESRRNFHTYGAASIARANAWQTGISAMRVGLVNFVVAFLFVGNPTLIPIGAPLAIAHDVTTAFVTVWLLAASAVGWLYGIGPICRPFRAMFLVRAAELLKPGFYSDLVGLVIVVAV